MKHHPFKKNGSPFLAAGLLLTLLLLGSCDNETPTMCPTDGVGILEGYLKVAGQGVSATIGARALEGPDPGSIFRRTVSDSTGWYRLELPTGLYQLEINPGLFGRTSREPYDTIRVLPRVFRFDIERGRAEVRIQFPEDQDGVRFHFQLWRETYLIMNQSDRVEGGQLVFEYPILEPGAYTMELSGGDLIDGYYLPGFTESSDADIIEVDIASTSVYEADFSDSYASISGSVTGSWQESGVSGRPIVEAVSTGLRWSGYTRCAIEGTFTMGFLVPQAVILRSENSGVSQWIGGETSDTARVFDLQPGDRIAGVEVIESGIKVLLDGPGDLVSHHPEITVRSASGEEFHPRGFGNNPFAVTNLRPGRYFLFVDGYCGDEIWAHQWYGGSETFAGATPIDLAEGELGRIVMTLERGGRIEGNLLRSDGTRPLTIRFGLFDPTGEPACSGWGQWREFDEGRFEFQGLADGDHYLGVQTWGDDIWWYPGTGEFTEAVPLTIENHADLADVDWVLP
ncbi:MAG: hypothetical protein ABFS42_09745 [Candidatus Krumholzibacteriota bacterium]